MLRPIRVRKERRRKERKEKPPPDRQATLTTRRSVQQNRKLARAQSQIEILRIQYEILRAIIKGKNEDGVAITALDLERYGGSKLGDVWFWLHPELDQSEEYPTAPSADNYTWGGYGHHSEDVERFVRDRAEWFYPMVLEELAAAEARLKMLETPLW